MGSPLQAEECFLQVTKMDKQIQDDTYLIPYSVAELGLLYHSQDKSEQAIVWLEAAKWVPWVESARNAINLTLKFLQNRNNYKGYSLESRLHFRIHAALTQLKSLNGDASCEVENGEMVMGGPDYELNETAPVDEAKRVTKLWHNCPSVLFILGYINN